ncbi:Bbp19 family protein [Acinetobacter baumannii]
MINVLFVVVVLALIVAAAFAISYKVRSEELEEKYWAENRLHIDTKTNLERELNSYKLKLKQSNDELNLAYEDLAELKLQKSEPEDQQEEHGTYVVHRNLKPATPELYRVVFELDVNGQRVLEDLTKRFNRHAFVSDSQGGERETCRRLGQSEPVNFILSQINKANDPNYSEVENDA